MRQQVQRVWKAFLKNIDVYTVIVIAIVLSFYSIVGLSSTSPSSIQIVSSGTLAILAILAFSLLKNRQTHEKIEKALEQLSKASPAKNRAFKGQEDAYRLLETYINSHRVREAVLLQYSCTTSLGLLRTLLRKGANVTVYIQHEETSKSVGSEEQAKQVVRTCEGLRGQLADLYKPGKLKIRKYRAPGSVSAVKIDKHVLCMGWYTYEHVDASNRNPVHSADSIQVSGHDVAAVVVWKDTEEFEALDKTFRTLEENYQNNSEEVFLS